jgi:hypothetical protein
LFRELDDKLGITACMEGFAVLASLQNQPARAARLFGIAEAWRKSVGTNQPVSFDSAEYDTRLETTRTQLNEDFATALADGREMTSEQAMSFALAKP